MFFPTKKTPASISAMEIPKSNPEKKSFTPEPPNVLESACMAMPITISDTPKSKFFCFSKICVLFSKSIICCSSYV